ncbi:MAG: cyclic nucleotide-binding domain-containing protein, partial [Tistlia sp.]
MSLDQEVATLKRIPLFANIDTARLKLMAFASQRMVFRDGQALCRQGDAGDAAYIIIEGTADVLIPTDEGPLKVATVGSNDIVGEIAILIDVPRTATVQA